MLDRSTKSLHTCAWRRAAGYDNIYVHLAVTSPVCMHASTGPVNSVSYHTYSIVPNYRKLTSRQITREPPLRFIYRWKFTHIYLDPLPLFQGEISELKCMCVCIWSRWKGARCLHVANYVMSINLAHTTSAASSVYLLYICLDWILIG